MITIQRSKAVLLKLISHFKRMDIRKSRNERKLCKIFLSEINYYALPELSSI